MADRGLMTGRQTGETIWYESTDPSEANGAAVVLALFNGRVTFANGEQGTYAGVETIDLGENAEPFSGSHLFVLADGSTCSQTFAGVVTHRSDDGIISGTGTWEMTTGRGRFEDLHGGGTFTWSIQGDRYQADFKETGVSMSKTTTP